MGRVQLLARRKVWLPRSPSSHPFPLPAEGQWSVSPRDVEGRAGVGVPRPERALGAEIA